MPRLPIPRHACWIRDPTVIRVTACAVYDKPTLRLTIRQYTQIRRCRQRFLRRRRSTNRRLFVIRARNREQREPK